MELTHPRDSHGAIAKPVRYLGVTDHDDFGWEPFSPPPDQQPASEAEDTPPHAWSGPPLEQHRREGEQDARSAGYGYGEQSGMLGEPGPEMRQQGQQAPPRETSTTGPRQGVHRSSGAGGGDSVTATPPTGWNYVDSIATRELLPTRKVPPARGWRRFIYSATFGLINPGQSPDELRHAELMTNMRTPLRGHYKIGVLGKGGVGKTTVAASVGSIFARLRQEDRVVAIDADGSFGKLGSRVDPGAPGSYWDLAADEHLDTFADLRTQVGNNADGLFVLPGGSATAQRRVLDPEIYREATARLDRHFTISIIDCGATVDSPVTLEVLRDVNALIVVSSPWVDGASAAAQTMEWLATLGMLDLLHRTVVVLNDSDGHADKRTRTILAQQFAHEGQVVIEVPFDPHLRPGGVIDVSHEMNPKTRRCFYEIAAAIAEHFSDTAQRPRERRFRRGGMGSHGSSVS